MRIKIPIIVELTCALTPKEVSEFRACLSEIFTDFLLFDFLEIENLPIEKVNRNRRKKFTENKEIILEMCSKFKILTNIDLLESIR